MIAVQNPTITVMIEVMRRLRKLRDAWRAMHRTSNIETSKVEMKVATQFETSNVKPETQPVKRNHAIPKYVIPKPHETNPAK